MGKNAKVKALLQQKKSEKSINNKDKERMAEVITKVMLDINKKFKDDTTLMRASDIAERDFGRLSIGNFSLDVATGGGVPVGGILSVSGANSTGKTLNALHFVAKCQQAGKICLWLAIEPFMPDWAKKNGVDTDLLLLAMPSGAEEALQIAVDCQWRDDVDVVVIDSIEALEPVKEQRTEFGDSLQMGIKPKLIGEYLRKFRSLNNYRFRRAMQNKEVQPLTLFLINQLREKMVAFGDPEYEPGGRALGFYSDIMIRLRNRGDIYYSPKQGIVYPGKEKPRDGVIIGSTIAHKTHKNKTFRRAQTGEYDMFSDDGGPVPMGYFDDVKAAIMEGLIWGIIEMPAQGSYQIDDLRVRGKDNLIHVLRRDTDKVDYIKEKVIAMMSVLGTRDGGDAEEDAEEFDE